MYQYQAAFVLRDFKADVAFYPTPSEDFTT